MARFADKVREHRERLGMKQLALAARIGLDPSYWNKIEKGKRPPPSVERVRDAAATLRLGIEATVELLALAGYSAGALSDEPPQVVATDRPNPLSRRAASSTGVRPSPLSLPMTQRAQSPGQEIDDLIAALPANLQPKMARLTRAVAQTLYRELQEQS
jgi:transcriptional regulator with XRE-family HTH domain